MKKYINKKSIIMASVMLLLLVTIGTTLAYIFTKTEPVENTFKPSKVSCAVVENRDITEYTNSIVENSTTKEDVKIKNTGDTEAYIRAAVVITWMSEDGSKVTAQQPNVNEDYTLVYNTSDWKQGSDGYWYYTQPVPSAIQTDDEVKTFTEVLINKCSLMEGADKPEDFYLSVEIVASAIQSTPKNVVEEQWDVTVAADGTLTPKAN